MEAKHEGTPFSALAAGDPKAYYEPVTPSNWKPDEANDFLDLYRRHVSINNFLLARACVTGACSTGRTDMCMGAK